MRCNCRQIGSLLAAIALWLTGTAAFGQAVVINEFMAQNRFTLTNLLGRTSDWVELYNTTSNVVDLAGWHLTDNPQALDKWQFPSGVSLEPFDYLLIHMSGHEEPWVGPELHADFQLNDAGEFLALVEPDGHTITHEYAPAFPMQTADVSFGLRPDTTGVPLFATNTSYRYHIPLNGTLGLTWTATNFNDAAWNEGVGGLGHDWTEGNFTDHIQTVAPTVKDEVPGIYVRYTFHVADADPLDVLMLQAKYDDGLVVYLNGVRVSRRNAPDPAQWDSLAPEARQDEEAVFLSEIDLSDWSELLHDGTNVLAVHVLNNEYSPRSSDLLFAARFDGIIMTPSVSGEMRYFHYPSPGRQNALGQADYLKNPRFSVDRGYHDKPFDLLLSAASPETAIRYTLDGSEPTVSNGVDYVAPLTIDQTAVVRARAFRDHYEPSAVATHSYLFISDIIRQPSMRASVTMHAEYGPQMTNAFTQVRTLSIVTDRDHIFGPVNGIYTHPLMRGELWERPTSIEWIDPSDGSSKQQDCGIRLYGGWSRDHTAKKSYRLLFKGKYGPTKLNYDLFPGLGAADSFDTIIVRGGYNEQFTRFGLVDSFVRQSQADAFGVGSHSAFVHLFINGEYWGMYNPSERPDQAFGATYWGGDKEEWDALNSDDPCGDSVLDSWNAMNAFVAGGLADNARYLQLQGKNPDGSRNPAWPVHLDVDNHIGDILCHIWAGTGDWPHHNWYSQGARTNSTGWKFTCWDTEFSMYSGLNANVSGTGGPRNIFARLKENAEFRLRFADHVQRTFFNGGALSSDLSRERLQTMAAKVDVAELADAARWGNEATPNAWRNTRDNFVDTYLVQRNDIVLQQLKNVNLFPVTSAPDFNQHGGLVSDGFRLVMSASNTVYYTTDGRDPREFGSGMPVGQIYTTSIQIQSSMHVKARARSSAGVWSALTEAVFVAPHIPAWVRISEVMTHPAPPEAGSPYTAGDFEFVEIANIGTSALNLEFLHFSDGIDFTFPAMSLGAGQQAVVVRNVDAFVARYPHPGILIAGQYAGSFSDGGERVRLEASATGPELATFEYNDSREWPPQSDGAGHSLVPLAMDNQSSGSLNYGGNWRASAVIGGSPGEADPSPVRDVVLNEVRAHTDYTNASLPQYDSNDWLELFNTGGEAVALTNWYLSDDAADLRKWGIPGTNVLASGDWKVFDEVTGFHNPTNIGFGISKDGETVFLSYLPGTGQDRVADVLRFKAQERHVGLSRVPDGTGAWFPALETPGGANGEARSDAVLSEVMYHPAPTQEHPEDNTADEYIEIWNPLDSPVALWTNEGPWRIDGGVQYTFPTNVTLLPKESAVVTAIDPADAAARAAFLALYGLTEGETRLFGPFSGRLSNRGDRVALERPQGMDLPETGVAWVIVDELIYFDQGPWPDNADGTGHPLQRISATASGNDPINWSSAFNASPGTPRAKIAVSSPNNGVTLMVPFSHRIAVAIDTEQVDGHILHVEFLEGERTLCVDTDPPYECELGPVTTPGQYALTAIITDEGGSDASPPSVVNALGLENGLQVTNYTDTTALLSATLQGQGSANVTVFWGPSDGGTNDSAWMDSKPLGIFGPGTFATQIGGLRSSHTYYYRFHAETVGGEGWSAHAGVFRTQSYRNWTRRMKITFPGYVRATELTNFPALVKLSETIPGFDYSDFAYDDGRDLRFADNSGIVSLNFEVEQWDTNGTSFVWVQIPHLASPDTFIYALWGNPEIDSAPSSSLDGSTWDQSYSAVWHLDGALRDSTPNRFEAENVGSALSDGTVGNGRFFDGVDDFVRLGIHKRQLAFDIRNLTLNCWVSSESVFETGSPMGICDEVYTNSLYFDRNRGTWRGIVRSAVQNIHTAVSNEWQLLTLVFDNNTARGAWNGETPVTIGSYVDFEPAYDLTVGNRSGDDGFFLGLVDEVRISKVVRPADWIWAEYMTTAQNASFTHYLQVDVSDGDDDDDGLFDEWEVEHFGGLWVPGAGALEDWDHDGYRNEAEFVSGSDPRGESEFFDVDISMDGQTPMISFLAMETDIMLSDHDRYYDLQAATNLHPLEWFGVPDHTNILGANQQVVYTNGFALPQPAFFRGRTWLQPKSQ